MANEEHLAILKRGMRVWNKWREDNPKIEPDLGEANLSRMDLNFANLSFANLCDTQFISANLRFADLGRANLSGANLSSVDLSGSNLEDADLSFARLSTVNFRTARLSGTNFHKAEVFMATFSNLDLSAAKGLGDAIHQGPSQITIDTIYLSHGNIPDAFLKGAGIPDDMIGYIHSIAGAIQFYSCFISYSSKDQDFADTLHAYLQDNGVRCWFAPHDVQAGKKLYEQIDQAIRIYDKLLLIISDSSINSEWVKTEITKARQRELRENRQMLYPVSLVPFEQIQEWTAFDADIGKDSARDIREYYIPDFSNWKDHDSYQKAFDRLLRDLKAEKVKAAG
jgi:hypothetical protein